MQPIVECVPNISEGRNQAVIDAIAAAVEAVDGVRLLDVDPGQATNRTVFTFVGSPTAVQEGAFVLIAAAQSLIDMRQHEGEHARQGATDVCPFVPVRGCSLDDCAGWARQVGERVATELGIPVYLYGAAASSDERSSLPHLRAGEYEGLRSKLEDGSLPPDFGPTAWSESVARSGATVIGARPFLIAYNVTLNTRDRKKANDIALTLRERGRVKRESYPDGTILRNEDGSAQRVPGRLEAVAGVGWYIEEYGAAQVSMNLTDFERTSIHAAFDAVCEEAGKRGLRVTGSELIGLVPLAALTAAGRHYLAKAGKTTGVTEAELLHTAVRSLGLGELAPFAPEERIVEYAIADRSASLVEKSCRDFVDELSSDSPAPGGGSVAALAAATGCGLLAMVGALTHGRREHQDDWEEMERLGVEAQTLKDRFLSAVDRDTEAFNDLMAAFRKRGRTDEEKAAKEEAVQRATRQAIDVPLEVLEASVEALGLAAAAAERGNPNATSDAGVAASMLRAAAEGAAMNVRINLGDVTDAAYVETTGRHADELLERAREGADRVVEGVMTRLATVD